MNIRSLTNAQYLRRPLALDFGASAWKVKPPDQVIGWSTDQRQRNLHLVVNNARFLILPWIHCKNLASRILALVSRRLPDDWQARYAYRPVLLETFVEKPRFTLPTAKRIRDLMKAFLCDLLSKRLARKTLLQHREHLCILGETVAQRINQKPALRRKNMVPVMMVFIDEDGGPLLYPSQSKAQRTFDSTCLMLRDFLLDSKPTPT